MNPLPFAVTQERAESTRVQVVQNSYQEAIVELECVGELLRYLPDTVDELEENGGTIGVRMMIITVSYPLKFNISFSSTLETRIKHRQA